MAKSIDYYKSQLSALRNRLTALLEEMEAETVSAPKQRQNKRNERILNFDAMYNRPKKRA